ncbi:MAG: isopentenyl phosphate kinase [Candidatus Hadarchaeales archaeon]
MRIAGYQGSRRGGRARSFGRMCVAILIVKLGGSVITDKRRRFSVRRKVLKRLAGEIYASGVRPVVVHGGGSFGHPLASRYRIAEGYRSREQLVGASLTHSAMVRLNEEVVSAFRDRGLPAFPVQPSACMRVSDGRIVSVELGPIRKIIDLKMVPVFYGDVVPDTKRGLSILSGDQITSRLAIELGARRVIMAADVDGIFTADPKVHRKAKLLETVTPKTAPRIGRIKDVDVTGGMGNKLAELIELAKNGVEGQIVNALKPGLLLEAIRGKRRIGTIVRAG